MDQHINHAFEWIPPHLQPWVLIFLLLIALISFALRAWPKLSLLLKAEKDNRIDQPVKRIFTTLRIAFAQTKLLQEPKSGWMHALIFSLTFLPPPLLSGLIYGSRMERSLWSL